MAFEIRTQTGLSIRKGNVLYGRNYTDLITAVGDAKGPVPGALSIPVEGLDIDLSELSSPGECLMTNQDATNTVHYGVRDPDSNRFFPFGELLPGKSVRVRLSSYLFEEFIGTGTGTDVANNTFHMRADTAACNVSVEAFER